jgi:hypothetical protein
VWAYLEILNLVEDGGHNDFFLPSTLYQCISALNKSIALR